MSWVLLIYLSSYSTGGPATLGTFYTLEAYEAAKTEFLDATFKYNYAKRFGHCIPVPPLRSAR